MHEAFRKFARTSSEAAGSPIAFLAAVAIVVVWALTGPRFHYSEVWQLVINTGTTIITFLMVFLIQNSQNRDAKIVQLKLDELLRAVKAARTELVGLEQLSDQDLEALRMQFEDMAHEAQAKLEHLGRHLADRKGRT